MDRGSALNIVIGVVNRTKTGFTQVNRGLSTISKRAASSQARVQALSSGFRRFRTVAIAAAGGAAFAAVKYESKLADLGTIIGKNEKALKRFKGGLVDIGKEFGKSPAKLAAQHYNILSAGITDAEESLKVMEESVRLSIAGVGTLEESVDLMTSSLNAFAAQGVTATEVAQVMNDAVRNGKTTVSELAQGFGEAAPLMASAGVSMEEFMAAVSAGTTVGMKASSVYVRLQAAVTGLMKPTAGLERVFTELGVSTHTELIASQGGLVNALEAVRAKSGEMGLKISDVFGNVRAIQALATLDTESFRDTFVTAHDQMTDSVDQMTDEVELKMATQQVAIDKAKASIEAMAIKIGDKLRPVIISITGVITRATDKIAAMDDKTIKMILTTGGLVIAFGSAVLAAAKLRTAIIAAGLSSKSMIAILATLGIAMAASGGDANKMADIFGGAFQAIQLAAVTMGLGVMVPLHGLAQSIIGVTNIVRDAIGSLAKTIRTIPAGIAKMAGIDTTGIEQWGEHLFAPLKQNLTTKPMKFLLDQHRDLTAANTPLGRAAYNFLGDKDKASIIHSDQSVIEARNQARIAEEDIPKDWDRTTPEYFKSPEFSNLVEKQIQEGIEARLVHQRLSGESDGGQNAREFGGRQTNIEIDNVNINDPEAGQDFIDMINDEYEDIEQGLPGVV